MKIFFSLRVSARAKEETKEETEMRKLQGGNGVAACNKDKHGICG